MTTARGFLSDYFVAVAVKRLSNVEANPKVSNQHEINDKASQLMKMLGETERRKKSSNGLGGFVGRFIYLSGEQEGISEIGSLAWYDSRRDQPHRSREWRLYYSGNAVTDAMQPGDTLLLAMHENGELYFIVAPSGSSIERQLLWLFKLDRTPSDDLFAQDQKVLSTSEIDFAARFILDELGIVFVEPDEDFLDGLIRPFARTFPSTKVMAELAWKHASAPSARIDPDNAILAWVDFEERLFRRLERVIVEDRIRDGFFKESAVDVDAFFAFAISAMNRRKSRAGQSLEHHLAQVFRAHNLEFQQGVITERNNRPDFLFPSGAAYHNSDFPDAKLTMLGSKTSLKDRWRQILAEADRITKKHLFTIDTGISVAQTDQMFDSNVQLVVPRKLHETYIPSQRVSIQELAAFVDMVRARSG
ncbi:type-2 restriction enzyme EcoRII [Candidatus Phycosocius bacilliformis]|uniref:Type-2 restriction enzyme EcoRII n=1 Tax=Candidatus Phycosocius bacilliformis TaxID=1445552 RepID=A0A2P2EBV7_9PROT|nr:type II restriction endonuclease [Candidatus Phycosocius bacilliformis]GBF58555.1 type-2 restriction enzyme EcoRII [Candidatus Phycosocius bacilliformis]